MSTPALRTVWVVSIGREIESVYVDSYVAVFSTREKAVAYVDSRPKSKDTTWAYDEMTVDDLEEVDNG